VLLQILGVLYVEVCWQLRARIFDYELGVSMGINFYIDIKSFIGLENF